MDGKLTIPTDAEVEDCITNIDEWINTYSEAYYRNRITAEDLAVAIPGECLFPSLLQENEEASREAEKGVLVYTDPREEQYLWLKNEWQPLDRILKISSARNGWVMTGTLGERLLVLVLTQLDYRAREAEGEVPYGCCPPCDVTYLLWAHGHMAGMASLKRKGTSIWGGEEVYACDTLDTLYVRAMHRRQGHTLRLLVTLAATCPHQSHLAISHPVSVNMCKVLLKFVQVYPELREVLWTLDEDGEVSGTVMLMLGSLMVRGALYHTPQRVPPLPSTTPKTPHTVCTYADNGSVLGKTTTHLEYAESATGCNKLMKQSAIVSDSIMCSPNCNTHVKSLLPNTVTSTTLLTSVRQPAIVTVSNNVNDKNNVVTTFIMETNEHEQCEADATDVNDADEPCDTS